MGKKRKSVRGKEGKGREGWGGRRKAEEKEGGERRNAGRAGEVPWAERPRALGRVCSAGAGGAGPRAPELRRSCGEWGASVRPDPAPRDMSVPRSARAPDC